MTTAQGYQPAPMAVAPEEQPRRPGLLKKGVQVGSILLGIPCVACLAIFGAVCLLLPGVIWLSLLDDDDDDAEDIAPGCVLVLLGAFFIIMSSVLCCAIKRKYREFRGQHLGESQGRVIGPAVPPAQPQALPPAAAPAPAYPTAPSYPTGEGMVVPDPTVPEGHMYPHVPVPQDPSAGPLPPKGGIPSDQPPPYSP